MTARPPHLPSPASRSLTPTETTEGRRPLYTTPTNLRAGAWSCCRNPNPFARPCFTRTPDTQCLAEGSRHHTQSLKLCQHCGLFFDALKDGTPASSGVGGSSAPSLLQASLHRRSQHTCCSYHPAEPVHFSTSASGVEKRTTVVIWPCCNASSLDKTKYHLLTAQERTLLKNGSGPLVLRPDSGNAVAQRLRPEDRLNVRPSWGCKEGRAHQADGADGDELSAVQRPTIGEGGGGGVEGPRGGSGDGGRACTAERKCTLCGLPADSALPCSFHPGLFCPTICSVPETRPPSRPPTFRRPIFRRRRVSPPRARCGSRSVSPPRSTKLIPATRTPRKLNKLIVPRAEERRRSLALPERPQLVVYHEEVGKETKAEEEEEEEERDEEPAVLAVPCPNEGCPSVLPRAQIAAHLEEECKHVPRSCPSEGCTVMLPRALLSVHLAEECEFVERECPSEGCTTMLPRARLAIHLAEECEFVERDCPSEGCSRRVTLAELPVHLAEVCEFVERDCPTKDCPRRVTLAELPAHLAEECEYVERACPIEACSRRVSLIELPAHLAEECLYIERDCPTPDCPKRVSLAELPAHLAEECEFVLKIVRECPNEGCEEVLGRGSAAEANHAKACPFRLRPCRWAPSGCLHALPTHACRDHEEGCEFRDVACEHSVAGCRASLPLRDMVAHQERCGHAPTECVFEGCTFTATRNDVHSHEQNCSHRKAICEWDGCGQQMTVAKVSAHSEVGAGDQRSLTSLLSN